MKGTPVSSLLLFLLSFSSHSSGNLPTSQIDSIFADFTAETPGCMVDINQSGKNIFSKGYGLSDLRSKASINADTLFLIGSSSKQFTATAIALLVEQKKLSLNDSLSDYFTEFPSYAEKITISDLIHHTSGIKDDGHLTYLGGFGQDKDYFMNDAFALIKRQSSLNFSPGTDYMYSNSGYLLLALIVEKVSGQRFAEFVQQHIFKPLSMNSSRVVDDPSEVLQHMANGYVPNEDSFKVHNRTMDIIGTTGVYTSAKDLRNWFSNFLTHKIGSKNLTRTLTTPGVYRDGKPHHYAFGLEVDSYAGKQRIHHGGGTAGYRSMLMMFPEQAISVALLCNNGWLNTKQLAEKVTDVLFKLNDNYQQNKSGEKAQKLPEKVLGDYWSQSRLSSLKISKVDGVIHIQFDNGALLPILSNGDGGYRVKNRGINYSLRFEGNNILMTYQEFNKKRKFLFQPVNIEQQSLLAYTGTYYSADLDITHEIVAEKGQLVIKLTGADNYPLFFRNKDTYSSEYGQIAIEFNPVQNNQSSGFTLHSSRSKYLRFVKKR